NATASNRAVNSSHSFTSFSIAVTTLTGSGGCCVNDAFLHAVPVKQTSKRPTPAKKKCFIYLPSIIQRSHQLSALYTYRVFVGLLVRNRDYRNPRWSKGAVSQSRTRLLC